MHTALSYCLPPAAAVAATDRLRRQIRETIAPLPESPFTVVEPAEPDACYLFTGRETTLDAILEISAGLPPDTMEGCRIAGRGGLFRMHITSIALTPTALRRIWRECGTRHTNLLRYMADGTAPDGSYQELIRLMAVRRLLNAAQGLSQPPLRQARR